MLLSNQPLTHSSEQIISHGIPLSNLEIDTNSQPLQQPDPSGMSHSQALNTFAQAETLLQQNCVTQALALFDRARQLDPAFQGVNYGRAVCLDRLGRLDEAESAIRAELSFQPSHVQARELFHELRIKRRQAASPVPSAQTVRRVDAPASGYQPQDPEEELERLCQERQRWVRRGSTSEQNALLYNRPGSLLGLRHEQIFSELAQKGIVKISNAIEPVALTYMKGEFGWFIDRLDRNPVPPQKDGFSEEYFSPEFYNYHTNNPFKYSTAFLRLCVHPEIMALINRYFGGQASLVHACATRSLAKDIGRVGSYQWHHDAWGRRVHFMVLLTDVGEEDQYMTYAEGTHRLFHPYQRFVHSRIHQDEFDTYSGHAPVFKATGSAGDVLLFDSNGIHSGNRTNGHTRDIYLACYSTDPTCVWGMDIPNSALETLSEEQKVPLQRTRDRWLAKQGRFGFAEYISFVAGLSNVDAWRV
jgi:Tetratricopeptide repeat/Phytanoyl-CoA dioxygenase (PhyH)